MELTASDLREGGSQLVRQPSAGDVDRAETTSV